MEERPSKRLKLASNEGDDEDATTDEGGQTPLRSLVRDITPPTRTAKHLPKAQTPPAQTPRQVDKGKGRDVLSVTQSPKTSSSGAGKPRHIPSPFELTRIRDLPPEQNVGTVTLEDLLRDPMIREAWLFDYLFDVDFILKALDEDVRDAVQVKLVHGFWKNEDQRRIRLLEDAKPHKNVELIAAYMPEPFGTHHSKMMILLRHDDSAQVVVHTANMIEQDWRNLTQAVWRSPLLPLVSPNASSAQNEDVKLPIMGSGARFKQDLLNYIGFYGNRLRKLHDQLKHYDFHSVRAAFIASVPIRQKRQVPSTKTLWGYPGVASILSSVSVQGGSTLNGPPDIVAQVSSIATLGQSNKWLTSFTSALSTHKDQKPKSAKPTFHIVFPTASEIRNSLDGYASGASIHMKIQSKAQQAQLGYMRPLMCHWAPSLANLESVTGVHPSIMAASKEDSGPSTELTSHAASKGDTGKAFRQFAAPHIKTYIRFSDACLSSIDWAMLTSANLSNQAWGAEPNKDDEVRICSYETGVIVWPDLFKDHEPDKATMVPTFGVNQPDLQEDGTAAKIARREDDNEQGGRIVDQRSREQGIESNCIKVGLRMPYDLPLIPYGSDDIPWCATANHSVSDWKGRAWIDS